MDSFVGHPVGTNVNQRTQRNALAELAYTVRSGDHSHEHLRSSSDKRSPMLPLVEPVVIVVNEPDRTR